MTGDKQHDQIIVNGYMREIGAGIPDDIMSLILSWYYCEAIHTIDSVTDYKQLKTYHYKIDIHRIIPDY